MLFTFQLNFLFYILMELVYAFPPYVYDEWSPCITSDGLKGYCIEITYCPSAVSNLRENKVLPDICDFNHDKTPIVCCVNLTKSINECLKIRENRNFQPFIKGGSLTRPGEFKHVAHIGYLQEGQPEERTTYGCGASLISNRFLLTAAHCKQRNNLVAVIVRLGTLKNPNPKDAESLTEGTKMKIDKFIQHPQYTSDGQRSFNDIGLIRLKEDVTFTPLIQPACLYVKHGTNRPLTATGWGLTSNNRLKQSPFLMQLQLTPVQNTFCDRFIPDPFRSESFHFKIMCLVGEKKDSDTCTGDSGGPVQIRERLDQTIHSIVGVISIGSNPCGGASASTRVSPFVDWIENEVWK